MTCRERLFVEHPEYIGDRFVGGCSGCPKDYGYARDPELCRPGEKNCRKCWDREVEKKKDCDSINTASHTYSLHSPIVKIREKKIVVYEKVGFFENGESLYRQKTCMTKVPYEQCPMCGATLCSRWNNYCGKCGSRMNKGKNSDVTECDHNGNGMRD